MLRRKCLHLFVFPVHPPCAVPTQARWLIKTAFVYLVTALALALIRTGQDLGIVPGQSAALWLPQLHFLTVGWLTQLIFGVAFWLFPNPRSRSHASSRTVWIAYVALNLGLLLRVGVEPASLQGDLQVWGYVASAGLQWTASLLLVGHFWGRVRTK